MQKACVDQMKYVHSVSNKQQDEKIQTQEIAIFKYFLYKQYLCLHRTMHDD